MTKFERLWQDEGNRRARARWLNELRMHRNKEYRSAPADRAEDLLVRGPDGRIKIHT